MSTEAEGTPAFPVTAGDTPEAITRDELAEAFDHEIDGCYVGGQEFAAGVFAYVRDHSVPPVAAALEDSPLPGMPSPSPVPAGPTAAATGPAEGVRERLEAALDASIDRCARCKVCDTQVGAAMTVLGPLLERAEAAEARLAEIAAHCRLRMNAPGRSGMTMAAAGLILGIAEGSDEKGPES